MCKALLLYVLSIKRQADCFHTVGLLLYYAIDRSAATAAAAVVAAAAVAVLAGAVVAAAAAQDEDEYDDPQAATAAKAVIAHTGTSYEIVDRPNRSQSIVCLLYTSDAADE